MRPINVHSVTCGLEFQKSISMLRYPRWRMILLTKPLPGREDAENTQLRAALRQYAEEYEEAAKRLTVAGAVRQSGAGHISRLCRTNGRGFTSGGTGIFHAPLGLHGRSFSLVPSGSNRSPLTLRCLEDVINTQPDSYAAKLLLGKYHAAQDEGDLALSEYQEALKLAPRQQGIHLAIGKVYASHLQWPRAIEEYRAELALDPVNSIALAELGHALTETHDANNAGPVLQQALQANPSNSAAYIDLGKVWEMQDKAKEPFRPMRVLCATIRAK